jgi:hypothetical protein
LEYVIAINAKNESDLTLNVKEIKSYTKEFDQNLASTNADVNNIKLKYLKLPDLAKQEMKVYIKNDIQNRVPVDQSYINSKPELRE